MPQTQTSTTPSPGRSRDRPELHLASEKKTLNLEWFWGKPHVEAALKRDGDLTLEEVEREVKAGGMQLWLIDDGVLGAVVTQIVEGPSHAIGLIAACGGREMDRWLHLIDEIHEWMEAQGCREMRLIGRGGWKEKLKSRQYRQIGVVLSRRLGTGDLQ